MCPITRVRLRVCVWTMKDCSWVVQLDSYVEFLNDGFLFEYLFNVGIMYYMLEKKIVIVVK